MMTTPKLSPAIRRAYAGPKLAMPWAPTDKQRLDAEELTLLRACSVRHLTIEELTDVRSRARAELAALPGTRRYTQWARERRSDARWAASQLRLLAAYAAAEVLHLGDAQG
jgi:hypothetical protein